MYAWRRSRKTGKGAGHVKEIFRTKSARILFLFAVAFLGQHLGRRLGSGMWFASVFAAVFLADNLGRVHGGAHRPLFLDDLLLGIFFYAAFGYLSSLLDAACSVYTGRHASPAVPAVILAVFDKHWKRTSPSPKRG